jgi:CHAT domain-containing protein
LALRLRQTLFDQRLAEAREAIDILHVACHGVFDADQALQSGIQLAPEDGPAPTPAQGSAGGATAHMQQDEVPPPVVEKSDDPWTLTAAAIFDLEMRADLVVLSACESGVNDRKPGDELIGLTRALIYAGTPSVVVSLWSVDEISTSILMRTFYQALRAGKNKAEALQQAQVDLMRMTAQDVIAYCEEAKQRVGGSETALIQRLLDWDIADLQFAARDFAAALHGYARIQSTLRSDHEQRAIKTAITRCQRALRSPGPIYYTRRLYCHPYYWAPFVVVGDWK